jgi:hypothetical protein
MHFEWTNGGEHTFYWGTWGMGEVAFDKPSSNKLVITFPEVKGIVSKVYFSKIDFRPSSVKMYIGNSKGRLSVANGDDYLEGNESGVPFSATLTGSVEVDENDPLKIWFEGEEVLSVDCPEATLNLMSQNQSPCNVKVTYATTEIELGPEHTFSFPDPSTFSGNTLTLTCTNNDNDHECGLTNRQAVLTLDMKDGKTGAANTATLNISDFIKQTGLTCSNGAITYYNHTKNQSYAFASWQGDYTVSVTVTVDGKQYTLTKDIQVVDPHHITNDCLVLSIDKYMSEAWKDDEVTITYKPQTGMILSELTVKATTDLTIGHGITDNQDNTYTFVMPDEDVTIIPTFTFNIDENDFSQEGDTYTIKSAEGWGDFATLITYDETFNGFSGKNTIKIFSKIDTRGVMPIKVTLRGTHCLATAYTRDIEEYYEDGEKQTIIHEVPAAMRGGQKYICFPISKNSTANLTEDGKKLLDAIISYLTNSSASPVALPELQINRFVLEGREGTIDQANNTIEVKFRETDFVALDSLRNTKPVVTLADQHSHLIPGVGNDDQAIDFRFSSVLPVTFTVTDYINIRTYSVSVRSYRPEGLENVYTAGEWVNIFDIYGRKVATTNEDIYTMPLPQGMYIVVTASGSTLKIMR